ncbi:MAG: class I SAM-dependent methyltransferase [Gemmatimonadota bacterium]|nr:class I SAM-dependent methyltransferase [Gemmatimonadota bacterium]
MSEADRERIGREFYDSSDYFEGRESEHLVDHDSPFQRYRVAKVLEIHDPGPAARVVDLGCGWGTFAFALADRVGDIVGVDFSQRSIDICDRRLAEDPRKNLSFLCVDAGETGLEGSSFDVALAADLFEHLYPDDSARVAREAFRLLRPGGRFVTWTPHRGHILEVLKNRDILLKRDVSHVDYKSMGAMRRLLSDAGFDIERAYYAESHVPVLRNAERLLQGMVPLLRRRIAVLGRKPDAPAASPDGGEGEPKGKGSGKATGSAGKPKASGAA